MIALTRANEAQQRIDALERRSAGVPPAGERASAPAPPKPAPPPPPAPKPAPVVVVKAAEPPPPPPPLPAPARRDAARPAAEDGGAPFDWESLIGVKLFSWIGGIALVL